MLSTRIKELRKRDNLSQLQLANKLYLKQSSISKWESGTANPDFENQKKLSEIFNVSIDFLLGNTTMSVVSVPAKKHKKIPVLGYVQAGIAIDAVEEILDYEEISDSMASTGDFFALEVRGDSMEPKMSQGDVVIIRKQEDVDSGQIAVVLVNGEKSTIKKIKKSETGITLMALNTSYEPKFYSNKEIQELPVTIIGRAVELRAKF